MGSEMCIRDRCYCLGSSLLRKESGRVFVVPLQLDIFVPVRDIGILRIMWMLTSERLCGDARCHFCCPYLCWEIIINDLNHQIICPGVLTTLLGADEHSRVFVSPVQPALLPSSPRTDGFHVFDYQSHSRVRNKAESPTA